MYPVYAVTGFCYSYILCGEEPNNSFIMMSKETRNTQTLIHLTQESTEFKGAEFQWTIENFGRKKSFAEQNRRSATSGESVLKRDELATQIPEWDLKKGVKIPKTTEELAFSVVIQTTIMTDVSIEWKQTPQPGLNCITSRTVHCEIVVKEKESLYCVSLPTPSTSSVPP